ncbi:MAG: hypothetical protein A2Z14_13645 [Chloroflexi bacterium RBG_16_48_8]|nr:MAG: hypothetical protein A2Z14_13645 [Chloroflexi bacterium RBG_16_48_8]
MQSFKDDQVPKAVKRIRWKLSLKESIPLSFIERPSSFRCDLKVMSASARIFNGTVQCFLEKKQ